MSTYRKIDIEIRDEDDSKTSSYQKIRKDGKLIEKVFIKTKVDSKIVSEVRGTSVDGSDWDVKGSSTPVAYKVHSPDTMFKEFNFMKLESAKIGGGGVLPSYITCMIIVIIFLIWMWFIYTYMKISGDVTIENNKRIARNNRTPPPPTKFDLEYLSMWQISELSVFLMYTDTKRLFNNFI